MGIGKWRQPTAAARRTRRKSGSHERYSSYNLLINSMEEKLNRAKVVAEAAEQTPSSLFPS
jgi:hypothetical protein